MRCDCHAWYPVDFVSAVMKRVTALSEDYAGVVYAARCAMDTGDCFQNATGWAFGSKLGGGKSVYRTGTPVGPIDHGWHGTFNLNILRRVGDMPRRWRRQKTRTLAGDFETSRLRVQALDRGRHPNFEGDGKITVETVPPLRSRTVLLMERHRNVFKFRHVPMIAILPWTILVVALSPLWPALWLTMIPYGLALAATGTNAVKSTRNACLLWLPVAL
jgi:hypothetical protein